MVKTKKKWGFLAPTRKEADEMEKKYGVHFTPLIDYMKVIFPDIDDWEEDKEINFTTDEPEGLEECSIDTALLSQKYNIAIIMGSYALLNDSEYTKCKCGGRLYFIDGYTQLTNATVKYIFGVEVIEPLFDENTPTLTQPWVHNLTSKRNAEDFLDGKYIGDEKQYQVNFDAYKALHDNVGLSKIIVKKLFDTYNYEIKLDANKNIAILIGPNGCGKTTILKIVRFMLSGIGNIKEIIKIPFKSITCELINGKTVKLETDDGIFRLYRDNMLIADFSKDKKDINLRLLLRRYIGGISTKFISAQRLFSKVDDKKDNVVDEEENVLQYSDTISDIKKQFKRFCERKEAYYNRRQANKEHCLFEKYMREGQDILDDSVFQNKWMKFIEKRKRYEENKALNSISADSDIRYDLYIYGKRPDFSNIAFAYKDLSNDKKEFLCLYLDMFEGTLKYIERAHEQTMLFQEIINNRFKITKKQLQYRFGEMYLTIGDGKDKKEIPLEVLSSGEKNDFIMFYNLIFNCNSSMILIDEPEISLHIEWQERYIDDLLKICRMNNIRALIATHSPNIINDHTDLIAKWEIKDEL